MADYAVAAPPGPSPPNLGVLGAVAAGALAVVVLLALAVTYVLLMFGDITSAGLRSNPLNIQTFEHKVIGRRGRYNYLPFVLLPLLVLVIAGGALAAVFAPTALGANSPLATTDPLILVLLVLLLLYGALVGVINFLLYRRAKKETGPVRDRVRLFNLYANRRITKDATFLSDILNVSTNPLLVKDVITRALQRVSPNVTAEDLASYFFTINLYHHFLKLGPRNPYFGDAMRTFLPLTIISLDAFRPSDYLYSRSTFIEDTTPRYIGTAPTTALPQALFRRTKLVNDAAVLANSWTSEATNLANAFYARDVFAPFLRLAVLVALLQALLVLALLWVFLSPERRDGLLGLVRRLLSRGGAS